MKEKELCWVLVGREVDGVYTAEKIRQTEGDPTSVEFDPDWVLSREETDQDVIGFFHTHPNGSLVPSDRDIKTMRAWVSCFGKPMVCVIAKEKVEVDDAEDSVDASCESPVEGYLFQSDSCIGRNMEIVFDDQERIEARLRHVGSVEEE